jgi:threonylcarbamoyladenosine tRNA methylthiotransferase MtaB
MRIAFTTVGCRLNQCETDALRGRATADGWEVVPFEDEADAYVINSCTITTEADADSRQLARRAVRRNPAALVVLAGCFAQGNPEAAAAVPGVDLILGGTDRSASASATFARPVTSTARSADPVSIPIGPAPS